MLQISELSKTYPNGVQALKNVSLDIPKGRSEERRVGKECVVLGGGGGGGGGRGGGVGRGWLERCALTDPLRARAGLQGVRGSWRRR